MRNAYFCSKQNLALSISRSNNLAISYVIEHQDIAEINKSSGWSILLDESTTITIDKHLAILRSNGASVMTGKYQIKMEIEIIGEFYCDLKTDHDNNMFMNQ
ncbi:23007_t:CDS:2 [Rhizophagus irregularis]|nr:23007_t:CDS:2 [Rhizophagus irregularis]